MRSKLTLYDGNDEFMIFVSVSDIRTHNFLLCEITISQIQNVSLDLMEIFSKELLYSQALQKMPKAVISSSLAGQAGGYKSG